MTPSTRQFNSFIGITTFTKLLFNITKRLIYPFAPEFARGLNVDLSAITSVIAMNQATSLLGPLGAGFADRYGYKTAMLLSLALLTIGCFAAGLIPIYSVLVISLFIAGLAKSIFDPSLQAFIGSVVPYDKRGRIIGIIELAWAGSTLAGIPAAGLVIERFAWQTPFLIISGLSLVCFFIILKLMPRDRKPAKTGRHPSIRGSWKIILKHRPVWGVLCFGFFMSLANDNLFVIYGAWLESSFHLSLAAIGFGTVFIGVSEVLGEAGTVLFADRIGLKKSVVIGTACCAAAYLLLPVLNTGLVSALSGLFLVFLTFEFTIVTAVSMTTELVPQLRASTMAIFYAISGIGRVIGAFSGGFIWSGYGLSGICLVSGICTLAALVGICAGFYTKRREP